MWDIKPSAFANIVEKQAVKRSKNAATDFLIAISEHSPVDTGRFSANNRVSVGKRGNEFDPNDFSARAGAMARGTATIKAMSNAKLDDIWIYNDTPYGKYLEDTMKYRGSPQAPNGVYRVSFLGVGTWYR